MIICEKLTPHSFTTQGKLPVTVFFFFAFDQNLCSDCITLL